MRSYPYPTLGRGIVTNSSPDSQMHWRCTTRPTSSVGTSSTSRKRKPWRTRWGSSLLKRSSLVCSDTCETIPSNVDLYFFNMDVDLVMGDQLFQATGDCSVLESFSGTLSLTVSVLTSPSVFFNWAFCSVVMAWEDLNFRISP